MPPSCDHAKLRFSVSSYASSAGYKHPDLATRTAAATSKVIRKPATEADHLSSTFSEPLVLPDDELSYLPTDPQQSLRSWTRERYRNKVTPERQTVYFIGPPTFEPGLEFVQDWAKPNVKNGGEEAVGFPKTEEVLHYLKAFYHGLPVKMLPLPNLAFTTDVEGGVVNPPPKAEGKKKSNKVEESSTLWLNTQKASGGCIGIRTRATPEGCFSHQLNLNDLLDAAIEILPDDAYALLMLVEHDIYEDDDDDFACGRAYGGSRIAVVSGARYNPILDLDQAVGREHAWPASHCERYMQSCCDIHDGISEVPKRPKAGKKKAVKPAPLMHTPMHAALAAHVSLPSLDIEPSKEALQGLWLGRVSRTASHELGHCFGIAHCIYYACAMQSTASIIEDSRQPPYLCPVDLAKVLAATGTDAMARYRAMLAFCDRYKDVQLFAAYGAWIRGRIEGMVIVLD